MGLTSLNKYSCPRVTPSLRGSPLFCLLLRGVGGCHPLARIDGNLGAWMQNIVRSTTIGPPMVMRRQITELLGQNGAGVAVANRVFQSGYNQHQRRSDLLSDVHLHEFR
jgi:hypothetical protein